MQRALYCRFGLASVLRFGVLMGLTLACTPGPQRSAEPSSPASAAKQGSSAPSAKAKKPPKSAPVAAGPTAPRSVEDDSEPGWGIIEPEPKATYAQVVRWVTGMVTEQDTQEQVQQRGLHLINLTWEDTGRFQGS